jgi:hypothetical protein
MDKNLLSSLAKVTKKEVLIVADHIDGANIQIFETQHPYSGYYGTTVPDLPEKSSFFLVTKLQHEDDYIIRAIQKVKKSGDLGFDGVPGYLTFHNKLFAVIRIRCISESKIPDIVRGFEKEGIDFMTPFKQAPVEAVIHITKYINTEELEEGIYIDTDNSSFAYLRIDKHLEWDSFEKVTRHVMNNVGSITFDAGLSMMYDCSGIIETVRIYDDKRSVDKLRVIRKRYLDSI